MSRIRGLLATPSLYVTAPTRDGFVLRGFPQTRIQQALWPTE